MFIQTGITVFSAIFQLFLISFAAGILVRRNIVSKSQIQALSVVTVNIFLPCLIIAKTLIRFHPENFTNLWILPVSGILIVMIGLAFSGLAFQLKPEKKPLMILSSMQNAVYIVLPIGQILFADQFDLFALYCFLLVLGLTPVMWSIGKVMISGKKESRIHWKDFITPPFVAIFISVAAVFTHLSTFIPKSVIASIDLLGQATVPLAVFILGATIGSISFKDMPPLRDILIVTAVKFVLVPSTVFAILYYGKFYISMPLFCSLMMIQAAAPPATNLILIVKNYGGDTQSISSMMFIQYLICILMMPLWIAAWQYTVG
ncbi:AEC family transporter [Desulfobacula toluolica]|uniref:Auxin efflux carrier n=1 Tax=Desulfobacula toluolica (strain DSM 7467 / Tol2) TaxID=651182 RepID=K0NCC6_DESTT|nr:AEC family transporter [Desulfobacula toluolica]CCK82099.1 auxin efflux carrier [Desulfobacula toluolica Tol2]